MKEEWKIGKPETMLMSSQSCHMSKEAVNVPIVLNGYVRHGIRGQKARLRLGKAKLRRVLIAPKQPLSVDCAIVIAGVITREHGCLMKWKRL